VGESQGVTEGGVLSQVVREITVEALPLEVPERIELDVSGMAMGDTLRLGDLPQREGVTYLDDLEIVLATVTMPTQIVEPEPEEEELEEGELPEGEEAPEGAAEEAAEGEGGEPTEGDQESSEG
jgi:large subunit ribosomal protein L25